MQYVLENRSLRLTVNRQGAEMRSLVNLHSGREVLWQADPSVWPRSAPILFPVVGKSKNGQLQIDGSWYPMPQHGFARDQAFNLAEHSPEKLSLVLTDSEASHGFYPFPFQLTVTYQLSGDSVVTFYTVKNTGLKPMLFSLGAHPGFALPSGRLSDYSLLFDREESASTYLLSDGLLSGDTRPLLQGQQLPLSPDLFREDALVFTNILSDKVRLEGPDVSLQVHWKNLPYLGIWTKYPHEEFICIEPWHGLADHAGSTGDLAMRQGIIHLGPETTFMAGVNISVEK